MKNKFAEIGRTMVEMLGVLAIIGLLSIVGIAGYKKAMSQHYVDETWNALQKYVVMVREYLLLHPDAIGNKQVYLASSGTYYIDDKSLLPSFAKTYNDFTISARLQPASGDPYVIVYNIKKNGLCSTMLPDGTKSKEGKDVYIRLTKKIDGIKWMCQIYYSGTTSNYEL